MLDLDLCAEFDITLRDLDKESQPFEPAQQPVLYVYADSTVLPFQGFVVINLTGPADGHTWYVRGLNVWNQNQGLGNGASSGFCNVMVTGGDYRSLMAPGNVSGFPPLSDIRKSLSGVEWRYQIPVSSNYVPILFKENQLVVKSSEQLQIYAQDNDTGQTFAACAIITDFVERRLPIAWGIG